MEFDTRARLHHNKKKLKQQQPHSGGLRPTVAATYHDDAPVREQQRNDDHPVVSSTVDPTSAGYIAYRDQDELTGSSSSDDSDSDSNVPTGIVHGDNTTQPQGVSQFGTLLNLDSPPASSTTTTSHDDNWISTSQAGNDLAAVFGNPSAGVKTADLLDITSGGRSDDNSYSKLTPPLQANRSASSSIEDLLFGGDNTSSSTLQQPPPQRPTSAGSGDLFGTSNALLQPQATAYREPVVIGNMGAQIGNMGVTTQLHSGVQMSTNKIPQKSSSATSLTKDDPFAQFVNLQNSSIPSSQSSTPGSSPWPGTSPYPGGSPRSGASPIPPATTILSGSYPPPRYGMNTGLQSQVMGSQYSQAHKNKPYSSSTTTQATTVGGGPKNLTAKKPQSTNYTSVIGGREERGIRRAANPTGMVYILLHHASLYPV